MDNTTIYHLYDGSKYKTSSMYKRAIEVQKSKLNVPELGKIETQTGFGLTHGYDGNEYKTMRQTVIYVLFMVVLNEDGNPDYVSVKGVYPTFETAIVEYRKESELFRGSTSLRLDLHKFETLGTDIKDEKLDVTRGQRTSSLHDRCLWFPVKYTKSQHISLMLLVTCVTTTEDPKWLLDQWNLLVEKCRQVYNDFATLDTPERIAKVWARFKYDYKICYERGATNFLVDLLKYRTCQCRCGVLALREIMLIIDPELSTKLKYMMEPGHITLAYVPEETQQNIKIIETTSKGGATVHDFNPPRKTRGNRGPIFVDENPEAHNIYNLMHLLGELEYLDEDIDEATKRMAEHIDMSDLTGVYRAFAAGYKIRHGNLEKPYKEELSEEMNELVEMYKPELKTRGHGFLNRLFKQKLEYKGPKTHKKSFDKDMFKVNKTLIEPFDLAKKRPKSESGSGSKSKNSKSGSGTKPAKNRTKKRAVY